MKFSMIFSAVDKASRVIDKVTRGTERLKKVSRATASATGKVAKTTAKGVALSAGLMTAALAGAANEAVSFESAMADVNKVVEFDSPEGFKQFSQDILDMSTRIPLAVEGLAEISAEAGAAGIALSENLRFTEFTAKSAVAFDMAAGHAGDSFAKIRNVYSLTQGGMESMADAVNHLSNNMASKAPQVIDFINRAGGAAPMLKATATEMAAIGSAMIATGTAPEVAARGMTALATNLKVGSSKVKDALKDVGLSHKEVMAQIEANPGEGLVKLFEAIDKSLKGTEALKKLVGQDFVDDFSKIINRTDLLSESLRLVADQGTFAGSVQDEFATRAATTANDMELLKNNVSALAVTIGNELLPMMSSGLSKANEFVNSIRTSSGQLKSTFTAIAKFWGDFLSTIEQWMPTFKNSFAAVGEAASALGDTIGRLFSMFKGNDEATSFGTVVGTVVAGAFNLLLTAVEGVAKAIDFVLTGVETLVNWFRGEEVDWSNLIPPLPDFSGWNETVMGMKVIEWGKLIGKVPGKVWQAVLDFEWGNLLPDWNWASLITAVPAALWAAVLDFEWSSLLPDWDWGAIIPDFNLTDKIIAGGTEGLKKRTAHIARRDTSIPMGGPRGRAGNAVVPPKSKAEKSSAKAVEIADPETILQAARAAEKLETQFPKITKAADASLKAVTTALKGIATQLNAVNFVPQGVALMQTLADGIRQGTKHVVAATRAATQQVRDHLPSSPAKVGPLSDIHRLKFGETIAASIKAQPMMRAMQAASLATMAAAQPVTAAISELPSASQARSVQSASRPANSDDGGIGGGVRTLEVKYGDIIIKGGGPEVASEFKQLLEEHRREIAQLVEREERRKARKEF